MLICIGAGMRDSLFICKLDFVFLLLARDSMASSALLSLVRRRTIARYAAAVLQINLLEYTNPTLLLQILLGQPWSQSACLPS